MILITEDQEYIVDIGSSSIWHSLYSTVMVRLPKTKDKLPLAIKFLETATCEFKSAQETAKQIDLLRADLSQVPVEQHVYDKDNLKKRAPWDGRISNTVKSCANLYTTADGEDLIGEIIRILDYSSQNKINIKCED